MEKMDQYEEYDGSDTGTTWIRDEDVAGHEDEKGDNYGKFETDKICKRLNWPIVEYW